MTSTTPNNSETLRQIPIKATAKDVAVTVLCSALLLTIAIPAAWAKERWMQWEGQKVANHMMIWREPIESWSQ
jgi:hypothetical protein